MHFAYDHRSKACLLWCRIGDCVLSSKLHWLSIALAIEGFQQPCKLNNQTAVLIVGFQDHWSPLVLLIAEHAMYSKESDRQQQHMQRFTNFIPLHLISPTTESTPFNPSNQPHLSTGIGWYPLMIKTLLRASICCAHFDTAPFLEMQCLEWMR
jgi:hypothetical protein